MTELLALGISHKTAPVALRERLAISDRERERLLAALVAGDGVTEAVAISTCNRIEIYLAVSDPVRAEAELLSSLATRADIRPTELAAIAYSPRNCDAARQLFRVTAGLESMIVGEAEVQGQVRRAYEAALAEGTTGPLLNQLFRAALQTGKRARTETAIGASRVSVSSVAVDLARDVVGHLDQRRVVVVGAGETAELTAEALAGEGVRTMFVANRRAHRAMALAERYGGSVAALDELPGLLERADIVVTSTSSPHAIIEREELEVVMEARERRHAGPLVFIDIAVPRDVEPACGDLPGVHRYDMDDLEGTVARHVEVREGERTGAEAIVEDELRRFAAWLGQRDVVPTVAALREHGAAIVERVLAENAARWETASGRDLARIEAVARAVMQRLLHEPTIRLKALQEAGDHARQQVVRELFGLQEGTQAETAEAPDGPAEVRPLRQRRP